MASFSLPIHTLMELLAYGVGFRLFLFLRRRVGDPLETFDRVTMVAAAIAGAGLGSKLMVLLQHPDLLQAPIWSALLAGKSVVGALLGGWFLVELIKPWIGLHRPTGDLYVLPLCAGIGIGRLGCFFSGLDDHTYGIATSLPWGVDFGDGVRRHPAQLYEIAFLIPVAIWAARRLRARVSDGSTFRGFLFAYLAFRFALDLLKPEPRPYLGMTGTQLAALPAMACLALVSLRSRPPRSPERASAPPPELGVTHGR